MTTTALLTNPATFEDALHLIDDLRVRNAELEKLLGQRWEPPRCLRLTPTEGRLLGAIVQTRRTLSLTSIYQIIYGDHGNPPEPAIMNVMLHRVRRKLAEHDIHLTNRWGHGYEITPDNLAKLNALYGDAERPLSGEAT